MKAHARGAQEAGRQRIWVMKNCIRLKSVVVFPKRLQSQPSRSGICIESEATPSHTYMTTITNRDCATYHLRRPPIHGLGAKRVGAVGDAQKGSRSHSISSARSRGGGGGGAAGATSTAKASQKQTRPPRKSRRSLRGKGRTNEK